VFDEAELRQMSPRERAKLMQALAVLDMPRLANAGNNQRRRWFLISTIACCVILAAWIGVLAVTLPRFYRAGDWRGAWVGFDLAELAAFAATAWAAWRGRQALIMCLLVLATLLLCDAWFDVTLDVRTNGFMWSLLSALLIEIPLAVAALLAARRLLRLTIGRIRTREGLVGPVPPLWRIPLFGYQQDGILHDPIPPCMPGDTASSLIGQASPPPGPASPPPGPPPTGQAHDQRGSTALR
jgi:hypothetical protein